MLLTWSGGSRATPGSGDLGVQEEGHGASTFYNMEREQVRDYWNYEGFQP